MIAAGGFSPLNSAGVCSGEEVLAVLPAVSITPRTGDRGRSGLVCCLGKSARSEVSDNQSIPLSSSPLTSILWYGGPKGGGDAPAGIGPSGSTEGTGGSTEADTPSHLTRDLVADSAGMGPGGDELGPHHVVGSLLSRLLRLPEVGGDDGSRSRGVRSRPALGLDKLCFYFNLLCFSVMLITCAYYAFKVNLLCSIMLQKLINNDGKYSQIYNCLYQSNHKQKESYYRHCHLYQKAWDQSF